MSYEPTNWKKGDKVTSARLNKIEQGIQGIDNDTSTIKEGLSENGIVEIGAITSKTAITTNVSVGSVVNLNPATENSTDTTIINCESGDIFSISGTGWNGERLWAFVDADNKLLSKSSANEKRENYILTAPIGAKKIVCNFRNNLGTYYGVARFRTAILPFHADGQNITSSTGMTICGNDLDSLPRNTVYGLVPYSGLANMPYADTGTGNGGLIFTLSKESAANATMTQFIVRRNGRIYVRQYWNNWLEWSEYHTIADISTAINDALSPLSSAISDLQNKTGFYPTGQNLTSGTIAAICSGDANNLPNNNIYGISVAYDAIANMPFEPRGVNGSYVGTIYTLGKETARGYGDIQYYVPKANYSSSYVRSYTGTTWSAWKPIGEKAWTQVLGIGDSICEGWRNGNRGFAGILGVPYRNLGITGATLGAKENHTQIYTEIENIDITEDLVIAEGGINDYYSSVPLGDMPSRPMINDTQAAAIDKTTTSGGLAYLLYLIIKKAPFAQRYFLITHKTKNYPYTKNVPDGYTQQELHDRIVAICKLYNFKIIDVYEDSVINSEFDAYKSPSAYSDSNTGITKQYYVDKDGIHPLALGYQAGYLPVMMRELQRANMT